MTYHVAKYFFTLKPAISLSSSTIISFVIRIKRKAFIVNH